MFEVGKKYRHKNAVTSDCFEVLAATQQSIIAKWTFNKFESMMTQSCFKDYVEVKEPKKIKKWLNIYADGDFWPYETKHLADLYSNANRVACKEIEIEYFEGEGL